jgi:hypothetical protein
LGGKVFLPSARYLAIFSPLGGREMMSQEPGEGRRNILRWIYFPYTWLVFIPYLGVSTLVFGIVAVVICLFSPRAAFHMGTIWAWLLCRLNFTSISWPSTAIGVGSSAG